MINLKSRIIRARAVNRIAVIIKDRIHRECTLVINENILYYLCINTKSNWIHAFYKRAHTVGQQWKTLSLTFLCISFNDTVLHKLVKEELLELENLCWLLHLLLCGDHTSGKSIRVVSTLLEAVLDYSA